VSATGKLYSPVGREICSQWRDWLPAIAAWDTAHRFLLKFCVVLAAAIGWRHCNSPVSTRAHRGHAMLTTGTYASPAAEPSNRPLVLRVCFRGHVVESTSTRHDRSGCGFCVKARKALAKAGIAFAEVSADGAMRAGVQQATGQSSVPQAFVSWNCVGCWVLRSLKRL
jgi:glutaredoxin